MIQYEKAVIFLPRHLWLRDIIGTRLAHNLVRCREAIYFPVDKTGEYQQVDGLFILFCISPVYGDASLP